MSWREAGLVSRRRGGRGKLWLVCKLKYIILKYNVVIVTFKRQGLKQSM